MVTPPDSRARMVLLVQQAIAAARAPPPGTPVEDEHLALLASGGIDSLTPDERQQLLRAVAADPDLAELIRDLASLSLDRPAVRGAFRLASIGLALAACLTLALLTWRVVEPPTHAWPPGTGQALHPLGTQGIEEHNYWDQVEQQRRLQQEIDMGIHERLRDYALLASAAVSLVLAIPLVWRAIRGRDRDRVLLVTRHPSTGSQGPPRTGPP